MEVAALHDGALGLGIRLQPGVGIVAISVAPGKLADKEGITIGSKIVEVNGAVLATQMDEQKVRP